MITSWLLGNVLDNNANSKSPVIMINGQAKTIFVAINDDSDFVDNSSCDFFFFLLRKISFPRAGLIEYARDTSFTTHHRRHRAVTRTHPNVATRGESHFVLLPVEKKS